MARGRYPEKWSVPMIEELALQAEKTNFSGQLFYANGITPGETVTLGAYMQAANLITYMTKGESFGIVPADSSVAGIPLVVTLYTDDFKSLTGNPTFQNE